MLRFDLLLPLRLQFRHRILNLFQDSQFVQLCLILAIELGRSEAQFRPEQKREMLRLQKVFLEFRLRIGHLFF